MNRKERFVLENYEICSDGKIFSSLSNRYHGEKHELCLRTDKDGYFDVTLVYDKNGSRMPFRVHRLVALKYLEEIPGYNIVNHKDLNKQNNDVNNLEWSTVKLNTQHGYNFNAYPNIKRIKCVEPTGMVHVFPSISHASRFYKYKNPSVIQAILEGRKNNPISRGSRIGLFFEYTNESVTTIERNTSTVAGV